MNVEQIVSLGPELADFLDEFVDCFGRSEPRSHMAQYIREQLSELPRKSVVPIALAAGLRPQTLQEFLRTDVWDHARMRDRVQQIVECLVIPRAARAAWRGCSTSPGSRPPAR